MVYLILYALIAVGFGWYLRPDEGSWDAWGIAVLWAVFWPFYIALVAIFVILARDD